MAKTKTLQNTTPEVILAKDGNGEWGEYFNWNSWRMIPYNEETCIVWAKKLLTWAKKPASLRINDFYNKEGIARSSFYRMMERSWQLKEAHNITKELIASRREIGAFQGKYKEATIFRSLPWYCSIDKEQAEFRAETAAKFAKATSPDSDPVKVVNIPTAVDTGIKPYKADE